MTATTDDARTRSTRLASHGLRPPLTHATPESVVARLALVQAQDFGAAMWAVGSRVPGSTVDDVHRAIDERRVIRSWPVRGTLHLLPTALLRPVLAITGPRELHRATLRRRQLDLGDEEYRLARSTVEDLLGRDGSASREQLLQAWEDAGLATTGQRGYHLIWWLAIDGVICPGPVEGRGQRFALLDEWAPTSAESDREATLADLFARYATGHGPVSERDFAWWTGLTLTDARAARAGAGDAVAEFDRVGDEARYVSATAPASPSEPAGDLALAAFDEYFLGYTRRDAVCPPEHAERVVPGRNGVFQPILVAEGRVIGTWARSGRASGPDIELRPFEPATDELAERFAAPFAAWAAFHRVEPGAIRVAQPAE